MAKVARSTVRSERFTALLPECRRFRRWGLVGWTGADALLQARPCRRGSTSGGRLPLP